MKKFPAVVLFTLLLVTACGKSSSTIDAPVLNTIVTTFAGSGTLGSTNGTGTSASFNSPQGIAVDAAGNFYIADTNNNLIRKITSTGVVTTLAGSGTRGNANGAGTAASFALPQGVAVDASGNVYVADTGNSLVRIITPAGVVSTFAGSGLQGNINGTGTAASFNVPSGIAVDASGNIYVTDEFNDLIRKITPAGTVSTLAGSGSQNNINGTGTGASFYYPQDAAVDALGNLYVSDTGNILIRKITAAGVVTTYAGSGVAGNMNGTTTVAQFIAPRGLALDASGNLYVASGYLVREVSAAGAVTTFAGNGLQGSANGTGASASFNYPEGVAVDALGNVYVADTFNNLIRKIVVQ